MLAFPVQAFGHCVRINVVFIVTFFALRLIFRKVLFSKVIFITSVELNHLRDDLLDVLFALLSVNNVQIELVGLDLDYQLRDCTFEVEASHQHAVVTAAELFLTQLDTHDWLQLILDLGLWEDNPSIDNRKLYLVQLLDADRLGL